MYACMYMVIHSHEIVHVHIHIIHTQIHILYTHKYTYNHRSHNTHISIAHIGAYKTKQRIRTNTIHVHKNKHITRCIG
jgi:hypothetical protein